MGNQNAGTKLDAGGFHGRRSHGNERISTEHLSVEEPGMAEAKFLRTPDQAPGVGGGGDGDAEFHGCCFPLNCGAQ